MEALCQRVKIHFGNGVILDVAPAAGLNRSVQNGQGAVRDNQIRVHLELKAETRTVRAGAVGIVEGEHPRAELRHGDSAVLTGIIQRERKLLLGIHPLNHRKPSAVRGCSFNRVCQAAGNVPAQDQAIYDELDVVLPVFIQGNLLGEIVEVSVHPDSGEAGLAGIGKYLLMLALLSAHNRRKHLKPRSLGKLQDLIHNLVDRLLANLPAAFRAVRHAGSGPEQTQIVVDLRHGADRGTGIPGGRLLVDGNCGGKPVDGVHVRLIHLAQEHPRIAGQGLDIAPLSLGIDRIKGQRALSGAGKPCKNHKPISGDGQIDVFEIVGTRTADRNRVVHCITSC